MFLDVVLNNRFHDFINGLSQIDRSVITNMRMVFFNTGVIRASFQQLGSVEHSKDLLNRMDREYVVLGQTF